MVFAGNLQHPLKDKLVALDAKTGKVVHKSEENAAAEAKEKAADMKKKGKN